MSKPPRHFLDLSELPLGELRNIIEASRAMKANALSIFFLARSGRRSRSSCR